MLTRLTLLFLCLLKTMTCQGQSYDFVSIEGLYEQQVGALVLKQVYERLNIPISIQPMPGKRAIAEAVSGRKDGEIMRIWSYGEEHPELLRVPTPYYQLETMGFYKKGNSIEVYKAEDLKKYEIFKVRGVKHTNNITADLKDVYDYDSTKEMLEALREGHPAVALTHTSDGIFTLNKYNIKNLEMIPEPLATLNLYHYIHNSQKNIIERVDKTLRQMKKSGELDIIIKRAEDFVSSRK